MIWGCMAMAGVGRIQVADGTINAVKYISSILQPKMLPSARDLFGPESDYIFKQDSAPCHVARKCMKWFADNNVLEVLDWPGNSPDINPIENLWSILKPGCTVIWATKHLGDSLTGRQPTGRHLSVNWATQL